MPNVDWTWLILGVLVALFGLPFVVRMFQAKNGGGTA
jgi:hypothetical protein